MCLVFSVSTPLIHQRNKYKAGLLGFEVKGKHFIQSVVSWDHWVRRRALVDSLKANRRRPVAVENHQLGAGLARQLNAAAPKLLGRLSLVLPRDERRAFASVEVQARRQVGNGDRKLAHRLAASPTAPAGEPYVFGVNVGKRTKFDLAFCRPKGDSFYRIVIFFGVERPNSAPLFFQLIAPSPPRQGTCLVSIRPARRRVCAPRNRPDRVG